MTYGSWLTYSPSFPEDFELPEATSVETVIIGQSGARLVTHASARGDHFAQVVRHDGTVAGDSRDGDDFDITLYPHRIGVVKITRRGSWWTRPPREALG